MINFPVAFAILSLERYSLMKRKYLCLLMQLVAVIGMATDGLSHSISPRLSASSDHSFCGTYPGRVHDELRKARNLRQIIEGRRLRTALAASSNATQDVGNIAVIEDDGTIVSPANQFDL